MATSAVQQIESADKNDQETDPDSSDGSPAMSEEDMSESESYDYYFPSAPETPDVSTWTITAIKDLKIPSIKWAAIRARVTPKSDVRPWSNPHGEGALFSMDLLDDSGEIRMTGFNNSVPLFYDKIKVNKVYYIKWFNVKPANKQFSSIQHDCELSFTGYTEVIPSEEGPLDIPLPQVTYNFVSIADIEHVDVGKVIDVLGVCKSVADCQNITVRRTGKELKKRDLVLMDLTCKEIVLTLWGKTAEDFSDDTQPIIIAVKGVKVSDFAGKSLSCLTSSAFKVNPDLAEAHALRKWYQSEGSSLTAQRLRSAQCKGSAAPWKLAVGANEVTSSDMEESDIFMCKVTLVAVKGDNSVYKACTADNCSKKVVDLGNGMYRCEKCAADIPTFEARLVLQCHFDFTGKFMATCFHETGEVILNEKGDTLGQLYFERRDDFDILIQNTLFQQYVGKFSLKMKNVTVLELTRINHGEYAKQLLNEIRERSS